MSLYTAGCSLEKRQLKLRPSLHIFNWLGCYVTIRRWNRKYKGRDRFNNIQRIKSIVSISIGIERVAHEKPCTMRNWRFFFDLSLIPLQVSKPEVCIWLRLQPFIKCKDYMSDDVVSFDIHHIPILISTLHSSQKIDLHLLKLMSPTY